MPTEKILNGKKIKLLHVVREYKFYEPISKAFNASPYYQNSYVFYVHKDLYNEHLKFEQIKEVKVLQSPEEIIEDIKQKQCDAIFFHSISIIDWKLISKISSSVIIIWWIWGYELYSSYGFIKPLINVDLFKTKTLEYISSKNNKLENLLRSAARYIKSIYINYYRSKAIKNIDYINTVTDIEFSILQQNLYFKYIDRFYYPVLQDLNNQSGATYKRTGSILIGNSSSATNNHLDILDKLSFLNDSQREIIVPLSYGDNTYKDFLKNKMNAYGRLNIHLLESFIESGKYEKMFNQISHAIFGMIRQQAIGNISFCLLHGVKIFLFKDSLVYKELKNKGYRVFTIDDDLTLSELNEPLSIDDALFNYNLKRQFSKETNILAAKTAIKLINQLYK